MKIGLVILAVGVVAAMVLLVNQVVDASPNGKITLNAGQTATVLANQCALSVKSATGAAVKVKCKAVVDDVGATLGRAGFQKITLSAGQAVKILANQCQLNVIKNKPSKVKVNCVAPADAVVTVGPGGMIKYSGDVSIHVGQTVEWDWAGGPHTVTSGNGTPDNSFCSPNDTNCGTSSSSTTGATYRHTFDSAGTFQDHCRVHGIAMTAKVFVNP